MKVYPEEGFDQLEFGKIKGLLLQYCRTDFGKEKAASLRVHTKKDYIEKELRQTYEFKLLFDQGISFPNDFTLNIYNDIKLLSIPGSMLPAEQLLKIKKLALSFQRIYTWFNNERRIAFNALFSVVQHLYYEKFIAESIDEVIDEFGVVRDTASIELRNIRQALYKKRNELRRTFDKVVARLNKAGYATDIAESFSNGRRVVAVFSEHKRQVKGIFHGESDSRKTAFIEPEETIELNNEIYILENEERKEVIKILKALTASLSVYSALLASYLEVCGIFDFINAKALLARDMDAQMPVLEEKPVVRLINAYHPLLLLYNKKSNKPTHPLSIHLSTENRILIISGPNAGGKTVAMKTIGLNQLMLQSGLLVPVSATSQMGIFKQLFIHIGDTQSIEFELSTYSSHLMHLKHFIECANGKTLFFIDELGSGSDPNMGGAFAEVIMEELNRKHAMGVVTTHYLNLKIMANRTPGIINGAMLFDEHELKPLYRLVIGKPGSSYTFSIAERIGMPKQLIAKAKNLVDENHFKLDHLLNNTERNLQALQQQTKALEEQMQANTRLKTELEALIKKEKHNQQVEILKHQNKRNEEKMAWLKETERKLKHVMMEWKKSEDKTEAMQRIDDLLFPKKEKSAGGKAAKRLEKKFVETSAEVYQGATVKLRNNHQVGTVSELRGKRAIVQVGLMPMNVELKDLIVVEKKNDNAK